MPLNPNAFPPRVQRDGGIGGEGAGKGEGTGVGGGVQGVAGYRKVFKGTTGSPGEETLTIYALHSHQ